MMSEQFEAMLMQAIVNQFFENPTIYGTTADGQMINIPARPTPVQIVAGRLLSEKNGELLNSIMEKIDLDKLGEEVAAKVLKTLTSTETNTGWGFSHEQRSNAAARKAIQERVDNRLVELIAQDTWLKMKEAEGQE